jgi:hypothetical protein
VRPWTFSSYAYAEGVTFQFRNLTDNTPLATIPIYITEYWQNGALIFAD